MNNMTSITHENLNQLEKLIGLRLPADVREKYAFSNGFKGPTGCNLLYPMSTDGCNGIIAVNRLREEPWFPFHFSSLVLVGDDGCGNMIGFDWTIGKAVLWNPEDGDWVQAMRDSVTEIWEYVLNWHVKHATS